ncbi:Prefoldin subunit 2 [Gaertneriomyces sp. JEL0708]|nr:Prefoldin [Gaertneriomyces semiglobifer]KAJ3181334.1 Prefoldin subunit 2 [Gaertneriomyces sp. JEL0708]
MSGPSKSSDKRPSDQEIIQTVQALRQELQAIAQKVAELEAEKDEHQLVVDTMQPLEPSRKCFRLIGGVLVERTVAETLPAVNGNMENIGKIIDTLKTQYDKKEKDIEEYQKKWGVQIR